MADYKIQDTTLKAIADSIRSKTGSTEGLYPTEMASAIDGITVGADYDIIEDLEIDLNLSDGNQTLYAPNGSLVKSAIIKKPDTLIPENIAEGINIAGVIGTFKGSGSGNVEGFATVTFMNGNEVIYTRPVYIGDDCPDPVTQGRIETPTKESTAQYNYTHNGWASVDGGTANSNVLKNIQADTVVYSAYKATTRKYTITYYDEDGTTVLHTEQVAYGVVPSYVPTKEGAAFDKWTPTPIVVTGNASYVVSWTNIIESGVYNSGKSTWVLYADYHLVIDTDDYHGNTGNAHENQQPWIAYIDKIKSAEIKNGVKTIGRYTFQGCVSLTDVIIPESVTRIDWWAFLDCPSLTSIILPVSVTNIGKYAFGGVLYDSVIGSYTYITDVYYTGSEEDRANIIIEDYNENLTNATWHYNYTA